MSRLKGRLRIFARALPLLCVKPLRRKPARVRRILIAHHLLLGDTLLLTPLMAKLRHTYPDARIAVTCPSAIVPLFEGRPFGVEALRFDPRDSASVSAVLRSGPYDLGIVAGDNRHAWLALGAGCKWIIGHGGDRPDWKNWPLSEHKCYPGQPEAWADLAAELIPGPPPAPYHFGDWPPPGTSHASGLPQTPYVVLHPGASTTVKRWLPERWRQLAEHIEALGITPVFSGGRGETQLVTDIDPTHRYTSYAGNLDLAQLWHLFSGARAVVCPDTGVAHLGRIIGVPTVALFGPGNAVIHGAGRYWEHAPFSAVTIAEMPCRDQRSIFRRDVDWVRRCDRNEATCVAWRGDRSACMDLISVDAVRMALDDILLKNDKKLCFN